MTTYPKTVSITEVGTRDGFQSEPDFIPTAEKIAIINALIGTGLRSIEATSFVSPRAVPQLRDAAEVIAGIDRSSGAEIACLVPNARGAQLAAASEVDEMVIFLSASESHNQANVNRSVDASLTGFGEVLAIAKAAGIPVQGAIATSFGCPFEGDVPTGQVVRVAERLVALGVHGINLGDTTGMATPPIVRALVEALRARFPALPLTLHLHNTRGLGLVNVMTGLELGIERFESSIGGLGGCPFAPGASGNICTEDLVYLMDELGIATRIDLGRLIEVAQRAQRTIGRSLPGQLMKAGPRTARHRLDEARRAVG